MVKRYKVFLDKDMCDWDLCGAECGLIEDKRGPWVRYDDALLITAKVKRAAVGSWKEHQAKLQERHSKLRDALTYIAEWAECACASGLVCLYCEARKALRIDKESAQ